MPKPSYLPGRMVGIEEVSRSKVSDFFSAPFWPSIPDKPSTFPPSSHDKSTHTSPVLPDNDTHKTAIPIDHPDGSITNEKIADGTIDLTKKCTYVPVNKAGDTMTGDLVIEKNLAYLKFIGTDPTIWFKSGQKLGFEDEIVGRVMEVEDVGLTMFKPIMMNGQPITDLHSIDFIPLATDPTLLGPGLFWFRSDLGRLRFSPDGTTVKEFVHRDGDTMTGDLVIEKDTPILFLKGSSPQVQISEGETLRFVDSLGRGLLDVSVGQVLVWNELNMGGNTISNIEDVEVSGSYRGGANVDQHWIPSADAIYDLGSSTTRWRTLYAQNTQIGDLGFSENTCPLCGKEFQVGDEVVLKVVSKEGGIKTRPCHKSCPP